MHLYNLFVDIECINTIKDLEEAYGFVDKYLLNSDQHPRSLNWYTAKLSEHPELMLKVTSDNVLIGVLLGSVEDDHILIGELVVHPNFRGKKIGSKLIETLEQNSRNTKAKTFLLAAREGAENFYLKQGYTPKLFLQVQSEMAQDTLDNFVKTIPGTYHVSWREDKDGTSKAVIETQTIDKTLQQKADILPNTHTQYLFSKTIV